MSTPEPQVSQFKSKSGWARIVAALGYSLAGLRTATLHEHAFRQELMLVIPGIVLACVLPVSIFEKLMMCVSLLLVLLVELLNSAIEAVVDRVSLEKHELSKNAKDFGSAAVFLSLLIAAATWGVILYDRFYY